MRTLAKALILLAFAGLTAYGLAFVYSSTLPLDAGPDTRFHFSLPTGKQAFFYATGFAVMITIWRMPYSRWIELSIFFFIANILLLLGVLLFGNVFGGARSWFAIGPLRFQPSETMKITWIMYLSSYLRYRNSYRTFTGLSIPFILTAIPVALILLQPDLGTAIIFLPALFIILFLAGARKRHLFLVILGIVALMIPMWKFGMQEYQKNRVRAFMNPEQYEKTTAYSLNRSLLAVGEGHWLGKGLGKGLVNRLNMLPEKHTDFIFSVVAEELGLVGACGLLLCYTMLIMGFLILSAFTREPYGKNLSAGLAIVLAIQIFTNLSVALGLMPTTGVTLPFISAGGSSVISCCIMVGMVLSISRHHVTVLSREDFAN